jgi:hypothetical protein
MSEETERWWTIQVLDPRSERYAERRIRLQRGVTTVQADREVSRVATLLWWELEKLNIVDVVDRDGNLLNDPSFYTRPTPRDAVAPPE